MDIGIELGGGQCLVSAGIIQFSIICTCSHFLCCMFLSNMPILYKLVLIIFKLGLERFHSVAILGFNSPEWFISAVGAVFAG